MRARQWGAAVSLVIYAFLAWPTPGHAQEATLGGTIVDSTGAVLPGVVVVALHEATGNTFQSVSDARGTFRMPVRTGSYQITVELPGFTTITRTGVQLLVGQQVVLNLEMSPSTVQESVTVTGEAPLIDTTTSSVGSNIDPRQMQDLPVQGRNWMDLTLLAPGSRANAVAESPGTLVGNFNINVDGQEVTMKITSTNGQPGYSRDAIGEFEIVTTRFNAAQGRSTGIMINAITKSGTNRPAGTFSGYFRDDRFNAADHVVGEVLPYSNQQWSGTFGGPIRRDRVHFFVNYEYEREPNTVVFTTPYPAFNLHLANTRVEHKAGARLDFQFSPATRMTVRAQKWNYVLPYNATNTSTAHPSTAPEATRQSDQLLVSLTQVLSNRAVNELKVSYAGFVYANSPNVFWANHPQAQILGVTNGAPNIQLTGFTIGSGTTHPQRHPEPDYNIRDDFTLSYEGRGRHTLKLGGEYMYIPWLQFSCRFCSGQLDARNGPVPANVEALFPVWDDVGTWNLAGLSSISRRYIIGVGNFRTTPHRHYFAGYVQDDWTIGQNLTLNLGVRYDLILGAWAEKVELLPFLEAGRPPDKNNFGPRVGFAYALGTRTSIRGGYGLYVGDVQRSAAGVTEGWAQQLQAVKVNDGRPDFASNPYNGPLPSTFEQVLPTVCTTNNVPGCLVRDISANVVQRDHMKFPYSHQASIGFQRQLGSTLGFEMDYVYNGGRNERYERNQNLSYNPATGLNYPFSDVSRRPFPSWGLVGAIFHDGWSNYHGLQASVTKRLSNRWQAAANYLLAWHRDALALPTSGFDRVTFAVAPDLGGEYTLAAADQRHRAVANSIVDLPWGFQVSGLYFFGSGQRFITSWGGDLRGVGTAGENRLRANGTIVPRNNLTGEAIHRMDIRLQKRVPLGDRVAIDGIFEMFNVFNHANYGGYATQESASNYGNPAQETNVAYAPRMLQLGFRMSF
jgi:hypothetical protein